MKAYLVVLDGTPSSWEAAYSAFHVAARLGSRLVGLAAKAPEGERTASRWLAEFETGARAAGIPVGSRLVANLDQDTLSVQADGVDGIFWGQRDNPSARLLTEAMANLPSSLWLVPHQTSVRRIIQVQAGASTEGGSSHFAALLARRLDVALETVHLTDFDLENGTVPVDQIWRCVEDSDADLLIVDRDQPALPVHQLALNPPCLTVFWVS